jgi:hypothetical protein
MSKNQIWILVNTLACTFFFLTITSRAIAAPDEKPTPAICKSDLKAWSVQKTQTLTIEQINTRMDEMVACADASKKHEKKMRAYLDEFYRIHSELATRAFDFITSHDLGKEFYEEKNGVSRETAANTAEEKL